MALTTCAAMPQMGELAAYPAPYRRAVPAQPAPPGRPGSQAWPLAEDLPTTTAKPMLCWPNTACASLERQAPTRADEMVGYRPGRPRRPRPSSRVAARRIGALDELTGSDTADAERRIADARCPDARTPNWTPDTGHRTPDAYTGQRTPGRLDAHTHWTPDTGRVDSARVDTGPHTGHWTSDAAETGQADKARPARIFWAITPSGCPLGCRTVFPLTAPAASASHAGSAVRPPPVSARNCRSRCQQLLGRFADQAAPRRTALVDDFGSRVERQAAGQVL